MGYLFKIDTRATVVLTNRLEKLHKTALPNAIKHTLNSAAFDVKQKTMPVSADKHFTNRKPNFFKANSRVIMAQGGDVTTMKSVVGFTPSTAAYNNMAVQELRQQEYSGEIDKRTFIPLDTSRSGESYTSQVLPSNRLKVIRKIIDASKSQGRNQKEKFIRAALAAGKKGFVIGNFGKKTLFRINTIKKDGGRTVIGKTPIYSFKEGRSVKIRRATHFMREASYISARKMNQFYARAAHREFQKIFK